MAHYINYYRCKGNHQFRQQHAPEEWQDEWSCMCNDRCPICNTEIEPYDSDEATYEP